MRSNPRHNPANKQDSMFLIFSERIRKTRTLDGLKNEFCTYFKKSNGGEANLNTKVIDQVIASFDNILGLNGILINHIVLF